MRGLETESSRARPTCVIAFIPHPTKENLYVTCLLLDLNAAFDMVVDHATLLKRLSSSFGVTGVVHSWIKSYLHHGRIQSVYALARTRQQ